MNSYPKSHFSLDLIGSFRLMIRQISRRQNMKICFIKRVSDKGQISTVKDFESLRFER